MRLGQVVVVAGGTKNLAAEITLLGVHVTEPGSAVGALRFGCPLAGIAVGIFNAAHQDDLAGTQLRHSETLTNFLPKALAIDLPIEVFPVPGGPAKHKIGPFNFPESL